MNKYCKVNSNVVKGTSNCTWYVSKRLQIKVNIINKNIFKVIINRQMRSTLVFKYSQVIDMMDPTENV